MCVTVITGNIDYKGNSVQYRYGLAMTLKAQKAKCGLRGC